MNLARKMPLAVWVVLVVVALHALVFWLVSDKRFLPKANYVPPPTPAINFGAAATSSVDPQSGEVVTEQDFTISTRLSTPPPARPKPSGMP